MLPSLPCALYPRRPCSTKLDKSISSARRRRVPVSTNPQTDVDSWTAIRGVVHEAGDETAVRVQVQMWLDSFNTERQAYTSVTACAELFFAKVLGATEDMPDPNLLRTAACMMLLEQVSSLFGRFQPLMSSLCGQVYAAIFLPDGVEESFDEATGPTYHPDPNIEKVLSKKYVRRTYFAAYTDLLSKHEKVTTKASVAEQSLRALWLVFERAIRRWQQTFLHQTFHVWRMQVARNRAYLRKCAVVFKSNVEKAQKSRALRNWCSNIDYQKKVSQDEGVASTGTVVDRLTAERDRLLEELQNTQHIVEARDAKIGVLQSENRALKIEKKQVMERFVSAQRAVKKLSALVARRYQDLTMPKYDWLARKRGDPSLLKPGDGIEFLVDWANDTIVRYCGEEGRIVDFMNQVKTGRPYLYLMRAVSPAHCSEGWLIRCLSEGDSYKRCQCALELARKIGVSTTIVAEDMLAASLELNYLFLGQCFRRFADLNACDDLSPMWEDTPLPDDMAKDIPDPERITPETWTKKWDVMIAHNKKWQQKMQRITYSLEEELADSLRRGIRKAINSEDEEASFALFCDMPINAYADLLTSMRGDGTADELHVHVTKLLRQHVVSIRKVYKYYCAQDAEAGDAAGGGEDGVEKKVQTLSFREFERFCKDCGIDPSIVPNPQDLCLRLQSTEGMPLIAETPGEARAVPERMGPKEFTLAILYISSRTFDDEGLPERIKRFVVEIVEPNAKASSVDEYRQDLAAQEVQNILQSNHHNLLELFLRFAEVSKKLEIPKKREQRKIIQSAAALTPETWMAMQRALGVLQGSYTEEEAERAFHTVQNDSAEGSSVTMEFTEFQEAVVSIVLYKYPCPFEPLSHRITRFFRRDLKFPNPIATT